MTDTERLAQAREIIPYLEAHTYYGWANTLAWLISKAEACERVEKLIAAADHSLYDFVPMDKLREALKGTE